MNYKQLLILRLSNLTKWKNDEEMIIPEEMRRDFDWTNTCEFLGDGKYILRDYYNNGNKYYKAEYRNGQQHGESILWLMNGKKWHHYKHQDGELIGSMI